MLEVRVSVVKSVQRVSDPAPPRRSMLGWLSNGRAVKLITVETIDGWLVIHAMSPAQDKFKEEIEKTERRAR